MRNLLHYVQEGNKFIVTNDEKLYAKSQGAGKLGLYTIHQEPDNRKKGYLAPSEPFEVKEAEYESPNGYIECPKETHLVLSTAGPVYAFVERRDPECVHTPKVAPRPCYDVWGTCMLRGDTQFVSPAFDLPDVRGKVYVQTHEVWQCKAPYGYGLLYLETSDDQELWEPLEGYGFPNGMITISQRDIEPGAIYGEEIQVITGGRYGRVRFDPACTIGPAFKATLTIEIAKRTPHGA